MAVLNADTRMWCGNTPESHSAKGCNDQHAGNPYWVASAHWGYRQACNVYPFEIEYVSAVESVLEPNITEARQIIAYSKTFEEK